MCSQTSWSKGFLDLKTGVDEGLCEEYFKVYLANTYTHVLFAILKSFFRFVGGMVLYMPRGSANPLMFMCLGASQVVLVVKNMQNIPMQETWEVWIRSLGQEDLLRESMATHSSILA